MGRKGIENAAVPRPGQGAAPPNWNAFYTVAYLSGVNVNVGNRAWPQRPQGGQPLPGHPPRPELRAHTGREPEVSEYVLSRPGATEFVERTVDLLDTMIAGYLEQGRRYITLAVGCTGGKHRSVAIAEDLRDRLTAAGLAVSVMHRDLGRE